jgi:hypothetical protein
MFKPGDVVIDRLNQVVLTVIGYEPEIKEYKVLHEIGSKGHTPRQYVNFLSLKGFVKRTEVERILYD